MPRDLPSLRSRFPAAYVLATRWADNDVYGHINNAAYYGLIDSAVNRFMIARAGIDIHAGPLIALVVETGCRYHSALAFPQDVEVALAGGADRAHQRHLECGALRGPGRAGRSGLRRCPLHPRAGGPEHAAPRPVAGRHAQCADRDDRLKPHPKRPRNRRGSGASLRHWMAAASERGRRSCGPITLGPVAGGRTRTAIRWLS